MKKLNIKVSQGENIAEEDTQWKVKEIINNYTSPWIDGVRELSGNLARINNYLKSEDVSRLHKEAEQMQITLKQYINRTKAEYAKFIRLK